MYHAIQAIWSIGPNRARTVSSLKRMIQRVDCQICNNSWLNERCILILRRRLSKHAEFLSREKYHGIGRNLFKHLTSGPTQGRALLTLGWLLASKPHKLWPKLVVGWAKDHLWSWSLLYQRNIVQEIAQTKAGLGTFRSIRSSAWAFWQISSSLLR